MKANPIPEGYHTITPYFSVKGVPAMIEFLKKAFDAQETACHKMSDGSIVNAEVKVGNSMVMLGENRGDSAPMKSMLYMYVNDPDALYKQAIKAGGKSVLEPMDQFYGDRSGAVEDPAGNQWWIAKRLENLTDEELTARAAKMKR